jgi:surface antigen
MIKNWMSIGLLGLMLVLPGCVGMVAKAGADRLFGNKEKPPAERIAAAQESAISSVHGGSPGTPIAWSDEKSGVQGALVADAGPDGANGCRQYQQTVILSGETLQGHAAACPQKDGSWKLSKEAPQPRQ